MKRLHLLNKPGGYFESWKNQKQNKPKDSEIKEAQAIFKKLTDPALKKSQKAFSISALMQTGKTQTMFGICCLWLDKYEGSKAWIFTAYASVGFTTDYRIALEQLCTTDSRFKELIRFVKPDKMNTKRNDIRSTDIVFFDEDQYGTGPNAQNRYVKLVESVRESGCTYGAVGATNISFFDACRNFIDDVLIHKIQPSKNYRGVESFLSDIKNNQSEFVPYIKDDIQYIMGQLCKHSNQTESERWGVYIVREKDKKRLKKAIKVLENYGMPVVLAFSSGANKKAQNIQTYKDGLEYIGVDEDGAELRTIISKSFDKVKESGKDLVIFIDGALGCGVNLDKWVNKELWNETKCGEETFLYQQNKPWVKGIVEGSGILTSLLQGLLGRICRYIDHSGKTNEELENLSKGLFFSFRKEGVELGIKIMNDPNHFVKHSEEIITMCKELGLKLYSTAESEVEDEQDFTSAIEMFKGGEAPTSPVIEKILKNNSEVDDCAKTISKTYNYCITLLENGQPLTDKHIRGKLGKWSSKVSFVGDGKMYNQKQIGEHLKFGFARNKEHDDKPDWGFGFMKQGRGKRPLLAIYKKGELIMNYSVAESKQNTAHVGLFNTI